MRPGVSRLACPARGENRGPRSRAALASVILHVGIVCGLCLAVARLRPAPPGASVAMVFAAPAAVPLATVTSSRLAAQGSITPTALAPAVPVRSVRATVSENRARPVRAASAPGAPTTPAPTAAAPSPPPSAGDLAGLKLRIREAVRAATVYPAVARQMHREGRAQVAFAYVDGAVQGISLIQSSRSGLLDEAALSAVRRAAYPRPLPGMTGVRLALEVWVNFGIEAE